MRSVVVPRVGDSTPFGTSASTSSRKPTLQRTALAVTSRQSIDAAHLVSRQMLWVSFRRLPRRTGGAALARGRQKLLEQTRALGDSLVREKGSRHADRNHQEASPRSRLWLHRRRGRQGILLPQERHRR